MAQADSRWPLTPEARVRVQVTPCGICGWKSDTETSFSPSSSVFACQYFIPPLLHTHLSPPHVICDSPDQAAHYHTLGSKSWASLWPGTWLEQRKEVFILFYLYKPSNEHAHTHTHTHTQDTRSFYQKSQIFLIYCIKIYTNFPKISLNL
jgi:hypothetical protein